MDITTIFNVLTGVVTGLSIILKYIAPHTKNKIDDEVYDALIKYLKIFSISPDESTLKIKIK